MEAFSALSGTPHGSGVTWLLAQNPDVFRQKKVEAITMFTAHESDGEGEHHLLFTLGG